MLDSHCHLDDPRFDPDRDAVVARAARAGVTGFVVPAVNPDGFAALARLAAQRSQIFPAFGVHPVVFDSLSTSEIAAAVESLPRWLEGGYAVGECGLDRRWASGPEARQSQVDVFEEQLVLAERYELPLIIHCVREHGRLLKCLERHRPKNGGVLHWYSGSADLVPEYAALGLYFGFGPAATWSHSDKALAALRAVPLSRFVLETDAPDQPLVRGQRNEPAFLPEIAGKLAALRGDDAQDLARCSDSSIVQLFGLPHD